MNWPKRGRTIEAAALSLVFHVIVLAALAVHAPELVIPPESSGPPEPIIPVLLLPKAPPRSEGPPAPIRLHRRPQRFALTPPPVAPLPVPPITPPRAATPAPAVVHPAPLPQSPKGELRATLRASPVGCGNPDAVGLTRAEREYCYAQLGKGAKTAVFPGLGLEAAKQAEFDRAAQRKEACRAYRDSIGGEQPRLRDIGAC